MRAPFVLTDLPIPADPPFPIPTQAGAVTTFEGRVRDNDHGHHVSRLEYSAYATLAEKEGAKIVAEAILRHGLLAAACVHRVGDLVPGDTAIRVWAVSPHRLEAFQGCAFIVDEIKARVPIWKRETYVDGRAEWVACNHPPR